MANRSLLATLRNRWICRKAKAHACQTLPLDAVETLSLLNFTGKAAFKARNDPAG